MLKTTMNVLCLILVIVSLFQSVSAQSDKAKLIDEYVRPFADAGQFSGVVIASENGKVIYEKSFGYANAEFKIPNDKNTRIGIASVTKHMTAVILARLIEGKKVSPEDKLSKYIPDFPSGDKITLEMLSNHRSGIPHRVMPPELEAVPHTSVDMVEKAKQAKLAFEPGTQRLYSSGAYTVLARVLEIASGKTYAQLLQEHVFNPAGMRDSLDFDSETIIERRAQDYFIAPEGYVNAALKDYSFLVGAGSVFGTAADTLRFGEAIVDGTYGPVAKARIIGDNPNMASSGLTNGHRAYLEVEKNKKYGYVVLSNMGAGAFDFVQRGVRAIMMGKEAATHAPARPKIIPNPNKDLAEFLGRYRTAEGMENEILLRNGYLYAGDIKLYATAPDCFFEYRYFGTVCFVRETAGKVREIKWNGAYFDLTFAKQ